MKKHSDIFAHTDCLSEDMLLKYLSGQLSPAEKHGVEKHLIDCEMCSDAVEGLQTIADKKKISGITSELNTKIQNRVAKKEIKIIFLQQYRTQLALAASIALLVGLVWFFKNQMSMKELDPASSEKIFADKFEPYKADKDANSTNNAPVTEAPELNKSAEQIPAGTKGEPARFQNAVVKEDKKVVTKHAQVAEKLSQEVSKSEGYYGIAANEKRGAVAVPSEPKADVVRDEPLALDREENRAPEKAPALTPGKDSYGDAQTKAAPAPVTATATGVSANIQIAGKQGKANDNSVLKDEEQKQQNTEVMAFAEKAKSEKKRSKDKKSAEAPAAQPSQSSQSVATPPMDKAGGAITQAVRADSVDRGNSAMGADDKDMAMQKYEQKNYAGATEDFEKTLTKDPNNYNALFYSAVSYMSTGQTDKAIINLNKVLAKKDGEFYDAAQWYLSLAYIKKNDTQNAKRNLSELQQNSRSRYQKQADETLKQMNK